MPRDIQERAFKLALSVITLRRDAEWRGIVRRVILGQLVKSVTSVGANLEEATGAQTKADFISKIGIARKEARETQYWLRLAEESGVVEGAAISSLRAEAEDVSRVVAAIARSAKRAPSKRGDD